MVQIAFAQNYDALIGRAAEALNQRNYCKAFDIFKTALVDSTKVTPYDYYAAAISATNCNDDKQALLWLSKAQIKGLGLAKEDIPYIEKDSSLFKLHDYTEWLLFISKMKKSFSDQESKKLKKADEWLNTIYVNAIQPKGNRKFNKPNSGFALYFTKVDSLHVPYLVYVPKTYNRLAPTKTIVFLHGGVVSLDDFMHKDPEFANEPIFSIGEKFNAIVVYPFGKKDFGWVGQEKAFKNIYTVLDQVEQVYNVDLKNVYLGGMSNGGTAAFWFASQNINRFKGFFAISALPKLKIEEIRFKNLAQGKPFYSINAKDDDVYPYNKVLEIYNTTKSVAKDWHFQTIETGGHGFIYEPEKGIQILDKFFGELLSR
ncbi:hypothetical protein GCM10023231_01510 [Olivibacter ginsenosidimutans]|uniref:Prolyl oligopeptidase family serine peptidase n=2 Tax=Olivibacter ginsenosidimutans TaxID=1176537 RepID=A0ABP9ABY3_9SPHI